MRTLQQIKEYLVHLEAQESSPEDTAIMDILSRVTTPQDFVAQVQLERNLVAGDNVQEMKRWYNKILSYANEEERSASSSTWETEEVITWLSNDEAAWSAVKGRDAREIEQWVKQENAPGGLYTSFRRPPASLTNVDWEEVAAAL